MINLCIPKNISNKLREAVRSGDVTLEKLNNLKPKDRRNLIAKHIGAENARNINALFDKAKMSSQKTAMRSWVWKNFYNGKPLYSELSLSQSQSLRESGITMKQLKNMSAKERLEFLTKHLGRDIAEKLEKRFQGLKKSGKLSNWEERVLGTKKLIEDKKLKGAFARLETVDDLGLLTPKQLEDFMEDLVSLKLGVDISPEVAKKISDLTKKVSDSFDNVGDDWTFFNKDNVLKYFEDRKTLENLIESQTPAPLTSVFTDVTARGSLLFSFRSLTNSAAFQVIPTLTRAFVKRIASSTQLPGDYSVLQKVQNMLSGSWLSKAEREFVWGQAKMGIEIYKKTGYDISRLSNLSDGFHFFGEKFTHVNGPTFKESKKIQEYLGAGVRAHAKLMQGGLKYAAGGTDAVFANIHRADTTALLSKIVAKNEEKLGLLKDKTVAERTKELMIESSSFNPKSDQALYIREMGMLDAHYANGTQNDWYGKLAIGIRNSLNIKDGVHVGSALIPFLKIPANVLGQSVEAATGLGIIRGAQQTIKGLRITKGAERSIEVADGVSKMITAGGLLGSSIVFTSFLEPDDFVGAYNWTDRSKNNLTGTKNAGSNYIRIGEKWFSTRWLGPMAIPVSAIMYSKQAKARGDNQIIGYINGIFAGLRDMPGFAQIGDVMDGIGKAEKATDSISILKALGLNWDSSLKWLATRTLSSFAVYDVWGVTNETKYDSLGRPKPSRGDSVANAVWMSFIGTTVKEDTSNFITKEFDRLYFKGNLPVITDPTGVKVDAAIEKLGEDGYINHLNKLKQNYATKVEEMIKRPSYTRLDDAEKKKRIDDIRKREILDKI